MEFSILQCKHLGAGYASVTTERIVKDYEIDFYLGKHKDMYVDGKKYTLKYGDICFRRPGQRVYGMGDFEAYLLTLDFANRGYVKNYTRNAAIEQQPIFRNDILDEIPQVFVPRNIEKYNYLFKTLAVQLDYTKDAAKALVMEILYRINAELKHNFFEENISMPSPVDKIAQYIHTHYNENITLEKLSKIGNLDSSYLVRIFKKKYNNTPINYLIKIRLNNARDLILETDMPIADIAECCGYNNESFFISQYKTRFGVTPSQHRKDMRRYVKKEIESITD